MTTRQKLEIIQKTLGITQTELATRLGVSFVAFNAWWNEKAEPRENKVAAIDELWKEVTGKKVISVEELDVKKDALLLLRKQHKNVLKEILASPDIRDEFVLKLTYHTNSIEGSTLTEPDTAAILFDNVTIQNKTLVEQLEAKNHQTAFLYLLDYLVDGGNINETFILKLHSILMNGIRPDAGLYRRHAVRIVGTHVPTANYLRIPDLVPEVVRLTKSTRTKNDIVGLCSSVHAKFEQIHPFSDGNGRIGRLLMNAMLLEQNCAPAIIRQETKRLYYTYLHKAQTEGDESQLTSYLYEAVNDGYSLLNRSGLL